MSLLDLLPLGGLFSIIFSICLLLSYRILKEDLRECQASFKVALELSFFVRDPLFTLS